MLVLEPLHSMLLSASETQAEVRSSQRQKNEGQGRRRVRSTAWAILSSTAKIFTLHISKLTTIHLVLPSPLIFPSKHAGWSGRKNGRVSDCGFSEKVLNDEASDLKCRFFSDQHPPFSPFSKWYILLPHPQPPPRFYGHGRTTHLPGRPPREGRRERMEKREGTGSNKRSASLSARLGRDGSGRVGTRRV